MDMHSMTTEYKGITGVYIHVHVLVLSDTVGTLHRQACETARGTQPLRGDTYKPERIMNVGCLQPPRVSPPLLAALRSPPPGSGCTRAP